jgi:addiction module RelE/StbE family toxin
MKVRYTDRAKRDLADISDYLRSRSASGVNAVISTIEDRIIRLSDLPWIGPITDEPGTRELSITRYPYKIYYQVEDDYVWIVHIRHTSRRPWRGGDG